HFAAPPFPQVAPGQVSLPGSPGPGIVYVVQRSAPVLASKALTKPRTPNSPPATPVKTISFTTSGAPVMLYPSCQSITRVSHTTWPSSRWSATRPASTVPTNPNPPHSPTPRLFEPQQ